MKTLLNILSISIGLHFISKSVELFTTVPDGTGIGFNLFFILHITDRFPNEGIHTLAYVLGLSGIFILCLRFDTVYSMFKDLLKKRK